MSLPNTVIKSIVSIFPSFPAFHSLSSFSLADHVERNQLPPSTDEQGSSDRLNQQTPSDTLSFSFSSFHLLFCVSFFLLVDIRGQQFRNHPLAPPVNNTICSSFLYAFNLSFQFLLSSCWLWWIKSSRFSSWWRFFECSSNFIWQSYDFFFLLLIRQLIVASFFLLVEIHQQAHQGPSAGGLCSSVPLTSYDNRMIYFFFSSWVNLIVASFFLLVEIRGQNQQGSSTGEQYRNYLLAPPVNNTICSSFFNAFNLSFQFLLSSWSWWANSWRFFHWWLFFRWSSHVRWQRYDLFFRFLIAQVIHEGSDLVGSKLWLSDPMGLLSDSIQSESDEIHVGSGQIFMRFRRIPTE